MNPIKIIQPGRIGDIIIALPIAKWLHDKGHDVTWPVCTEFFHMFDSTPYVKPIDLGPHNNNPQTMLNKYFEAQKCPGEGIDLSIGFSNKELDDSWLITGLAFDEWKYCKAQVPFEEKYKLSLNRNPEKEQTLFDRLVTKKPYTVTHSIGNSVRCDFGIESIEIRPLENSSVFDWLKILKEAEEIFCVDSCIANLINQLGIAIGKRTFVGGRKPPHLLPKLAEGWKICE